MRATFTHLVGSRKGQAEKFESNSISVGRAEDNALRFGDGDRRVSSHHAEVRRKGDHYVLRDLGSTNGTMINGRRVITSELRHDDLIEFGAGGPLVRFGVENEADIGGRPADARDQARAIGQSTVEMMVNRAVRSRAGNHWLIIALIVAMLAGAAGGILLASRTSLGSKSWSAIAARNGPAVVFIRTEFELIDEAGAVVTTDARTGTGFVVSADGLIITNRHLLRDWEYNHPRPGVTGRITKVEVIFPGQKREQAWIAQLARLADSPEIDVAILKINSKTDLPRVHGVEAELDEIKQGDEVAVMGYPLGMDLLQLTNDDRLEPSLSTGVVSRISHDTVQLHLSAYQGGSGGPVLDRRGHVIGILTANVGNAEDIAFSIPVSVAFELIRGER
jgi:serine protease Do